MLQRLILFLILVFLLQRLGEPVESFSPNLTGRDEVLSAVDGSFKAWAYAMPTWLNSLVGIGIFGAVYVSMGCAAARLLRRRYPASADRRVPEPGRLKSDGAS